MKAIVAGLWVVPVCMLIWSLSVGSAHAAGEYEITRFESGLSQYQAASHPDMTTAFTLAQEPAPGQLGTGDCFLGLPCRVVKGGAPKDVVVQLPPGIVANVKGVPQCTNQELIDVACPVGSQIGVLEAGVIIAGFPPDNTGLTPLFNMVPSRGEVAAFGARVANQINTRVSLKVRKGGNYGVEASVRNISDLYPMWLSALTVWGVPQELSHDAERHCLGSGAPGWAGCPPAEPGKPFLAAPAHCGVAEAASLQVRSYQRPTDADWSWAFTDMPPVTGCERLIFEPRMTVTPTSGRAAMPSGIDVSLTIPQHFDEASYEPFSLGPNGEVQPTHEPITGGLETPPLKRAVLKLPQGVAVNPSSADGLGSCSMEEIGISADGLANGDPVECPLSSKIGTVVATTPVLSETFEGSVYLARQSENPFNSLLAVYLVIENEERGILIKIPGKVDADPDTGRLTVTFDNAPQLPVSTLRVNLKSGPRAPIVSPSVCGHYTTDIELASWGGQIAHTSSSFDIDNGCGAAGQFTPGFEAATSNPVGGGYSPFTLRVTRSDGQQNVSAIEATLPKGLLARLAGIPLCSDAQAISSDCPTASQVGTVTVGAGAGSNPIYVPQAGKARTAAYLAGPYKGAPYSLVVKVPAQAGPFDLGTVAVRNALFVDPETAQVTAKSDPLPQILQGIPITYRDIRIEIDRGGFMLNPTSCDPMAVSSRLTGAAGASASRSDHFQVGSCERLPFKPTLSVKVTGKHRRGAYQKLRAELRAGQGESNIGRVSVALPHSEFLAQNHIKTVCTRVQYAARQCPAASIYGHARAWTPLLDQPLEGPVYLRSSSHKLPDLVASLDGQIHIDLDGRIDSFKRGIRNTFESVPDAPVTKFVLEMNGGKKSLLVNSTNVCRASNRATVKMVGQNGKTFESTPALKTTCHRKKSRRRKAGK
jgi:hypothetical protein